MITYLAAVQLAWLALEMEHDACERGLVAAATLWHMRASRYMIEAEQCL